MAVPSDLRAEKQHGEQESGSARPGDVTYLRSRQLAPRARDLWFPKTTAFASISPEEAGHASPSGALA